MNHELSRTAIPSVRVTVISDAICPWCYIGKANLEAAIDSLVGQVNVEVSWKPFELNPEMPDGGMSRRDYRSAKFGTWARSQALDAQVEAAARRAGIEIHHERMQRTPNTLAAHRLIWLAGKHGVQQAIVDALFRAYFVEGRDIGQPEVLAAMAQRGGLTEVPVTEFLHGEEGIDDVRNELARAHRLGVSGVPTFIFEERTALSGAQPPAVIRDAILDIAQVHD